MSDNECLLCGAPSGYPYCGPPCEAADNPEEGEEYPMAIRQITCFEAVCDLCGTSETTADYTPHAPTAQAVIDIVTEKWGDPKSGWTHTADGRLVCDTVDDPAHRAVHEEAGKAISDCAMTVTFA